MKRWVLPILLCLFLGALTTVATAWALCWHARDMWQQTSEYFGTEHFEVKTEVCPPQFKSQESQWVAPSPDAELTLRDFELYGDDYGWPALALESRIWLRYEVWTPDTPFVNVAGESYILSIVGIMLPESDMGDDFAYGPGYILPVKPLWPGFAINTTLFTALWFALSLMLRTLRRRLRLRRNACPSCGYSLTGNTSGTCPECGSLRTPLLQRAKRGDPR